MKLINSGMIYVVIIMLALAFFSASLTDGLIPEFNPVNTNPPVTPVAPINTGENNNLQLYTFGFTTPGPIIPPKPPAPPP